MPKTVGLGFVPEIMRLQENIDKRLGLADMPDSKRFAATDGQLPESNRKVADKILARFDAENMPQLLSESKKLSGGAGVVSDVAVPAIYERTVIREALYAMKALELVDGDTEVFAPSIMIPFSYRDTTAAGRDNTRAYEGQEIQRAGVIQSSESAFPIPQKLAFQVSDEMRLLTSASQYNWDTVTENARNASRIIGEDTDRLLFNEMLHASDEYVAVAVSNENVGAAFDGSFTVFPLAHFPVVRPRSVFDQQGVQVGSTVNPIAVNYDGSARSEYDGSGTQPAGVYWVLNYNQGELMLVDETGATIVPPNGTACTISYSYATNVYAFDTDLGSSDADAHWDTFLYRYGLRKSIIEDDRYYMANFGLMSGVAMTQIEQAKKFSANFKTPGTSLDENGNLGRIKDVPNYKTAGPGLWFGDQRILIGQKGITRYRMLKPWVMGSLENQRGANGRFTGLKEAYGDQFIAVHTPTPLKAAYTSIVLYSATGRVAR